MLRSYVQRRAINTGIQPPCFVGGKIDPVLIKPIGDTDGMYEAGCEYDRGAETTFALGLIIRAEDRCCISQRLWIHGFDG